MATFLMIHGAWHGGWSFEPLRSGLDACGHRLIAPDLPGMGGDDATLAGVTLAGWADFVADLARAQPEPVMLCGHSRGGIVISEAAERAPDAVAALVYIAGYLVPNGRSLMSLVEEVTRDPEFDAGLHIVAGGAAMALSPQGAAAAFYMLSPEAARGDACSRIVPEPMAPSLTPLALSAERYGRVPRHYIECTADRAVSLAQQRSMQESLPCASVSTLASDHSPFLSCPAALIAALDAISRTAA